MSTSPIEDKVLIEKFLSGFLSQEEELLFLDRKKDETFNNELEEAIIYQLGRQQLKEKLKNISTSQKNLILVKPIYRYSKIAMAIAAIAIILFSINLFFKTDQFSLNTEQLYTDYYEPYPNIYSTKGISEDRMSTIDEAMQLYDAERYATAVSSFAKITQESKTNNNVTFYYGQSLLANRDYQTAKVELKKISAGHPLYNEAQWYLGLIYLKQDSLEKTRRIYKGLLSSVGVIKQKRITELLKQIENINNHD